MLALLYCKARFVFNAKFMTSCLRLVVNRVFVIVQETIVKTISFNRFSNKTMPQLVGVLAVNDGLQKASKLEFKGDMIGPEAFTVDQNGKKLCSNSSIS